MIFGRPLAVCVAKQELHDFNPEGALEGPKKLQGLAKANTVALSVEATST